MEIAILFLIIAVVFVILTIMLYVAVRFEWRFGVSAIAGEAHASRQSGPTTTSLLRAPGTTEKARVISS